MPLLAASILTPLTKNSLDIEITAQKSASPVHPPNIPSAKSVRNAVETMILSLSASMNFPKVVTIFRRRAK